MEAVISREGPFRNLQVGFIASRSNDTMPEQEVWDPEEA